VKKIPQNVAQCIFVKNNAQPYPCKKYPKLWDTSTIFKNTNSK
jgi:hypothetical protein